MAEANSTIIGDDFVLVDFTPEYVAGLTPDDGSGRARVPYGDVRLQIVQLESQTAKNSQNPHVMLKVTSEVKEHPSNPEAVGMRISELYAGSKESPKRMQGRLRCLLDACDVKPIPGQGLRPRVQLLNRVYDATIIWELSNPTVGNDGLERRYVNDRPKYERKTNAARPEHVDPERESAAAVKFANDGFPTGGTPAGDTAPWGAEAGGADAGGGVVETTPSWHPEAAATDPAIHAYRALIKMNAPNATEARAALVAAGFNPDGDIRVDLLTDPLRGQYIAAVAPPKVTTVTPPQGLAPLGAAPSATGNGQVIPPLAAAQPRTGTRAPAKR